MDFKNTENCYESGVKLAFFPLILNIPLYNLEVFVAVCNHDLARTKCSQRANSFKSKNTI